VNLLFLDQYGDLGGAQGCLLDLMPAIRDRGWVAHAAVPGAGPLAERLRATGAMVHEIRGGRYRPGTKTPADFLRFPFDIARQARTIGRLLDETQFDLVYVNGARLLPAAAMAVQGRAPVVFHAHWRYAGAAAMAARWSIRRSSATAIACCRYVAAPLGAPEPRLHVIPNGVADCGFRERCFDAAAGFRIGIIGRIAPEKGQAEFLRAAALLAPEFPNARFAICGAPLFGEQGYFSEQGYDDEVRRRARGLPVEFLGWRDDVAGVLRQLDLLVIASSEEGLPRVLLEAFSAGVPVVAFPAGGIPEALEDERTGFLVRQSSAEALAARIRTLMTGDPTRLREVAHNARQAWERCYDVSHYRRGVTNLLAALTPASRAEIRTSALLLRTPRPQAAVPESIPADR
jgi:glycosyltransferase involved in cell wall biosynthesis